MTQREKDNEALASKILRRIYSCLSQRCEVMANKGRFGKQAFVGLKILKASSKIQYQRCMDVYTST